MPSPSSESAQQQATTEIDLAATVPLGPDALLLVTGGTGLVGSHVAQRARQDGVPVRCLVRPGTPADWLEQLGVEIVRGDLLDAQSLAPAAQGVTHVVHCAAKVGDWGPVDDYRRVNVGGLKNLIDAVRNGGRLQRFVQISSLGVYPARDHYGTDETTPVDPSGIDGYTLSKYESEQLVLDYAANEGFPAVVLRPGFIYGPRDRTILPRLLERLANGQFVYLGDREKLMNNTFAGNLADAVSAALTRPNVVGRAYNITDGRLVTKREFIETITQTAGYPDPQRAIPLPIAKILARVLESAWRMLGKDEAPLLSNARVKFLGLNLDYAIDRARDELQYTPAVDFRDAMRQTVDWFRQAGQLPPRRGVRS